jgi:hypothetical protein
MGRTGRVLVNQPAHKNFKVEVHLHVEQVGIGEPPSAKEAVDTPHVISKIATANSKSFFMDFSLRGSSA